MRESKHLNVRDRLYSVLSGSYNGWDNWILVKFSVGK